MGAMTLKLGRNIPWMDLYNFAEYDWPWCVFKVTGPRQMKKLAHLSLKDYSTNRNQIWYECSLLQAKYAETCFFCVSWKTRAVTPFFMLAAENFNIGLYSDAMGAPTLKLGRIIAWMDLYNFAEYDWPWRIFKVTGPRQMKKLAHLLSQRLFYHFAPNLVWMFITAN